MKQGAKQGNTKRKKPATRCAAGDFGDGAEGLNTHMSNQYLFNFDKYTVIFAVEFNAH